MGSRPRVKGKVDIIICGGDAAIRAAQQATATIPILGLTDDMVGAGLVHSLANPAGNTTADCAALAARPRRRADRVGIPLRERRRNISAAFSI